MSRIGKAPIEIPAGVEVSIVERTVKVKGKLGELSLDLFPTIDVVVEGNQILVSPKNQEKQTKAMHGTTRALIANMVKGVSVGFEIKLTLVGVGYRAKAEGQKIKLELGFSHDVELEMPAGVSVQTPTQTEIIVKGFDRQKVAQIAAKLRNDYRPPEPYKGKGIRYADEVVIIKETKKK